MNALVQVALGGAMGASLRYGVNLGMQRLLGSGFPWHTLTANVLGSAAMGVLMVALAHRGHQHLAPLLMTGLLGGFTTFSAFSMDTVALAERGLMTAAALYVAASVLIALAAFVLAVHLTRSILT
ncbi:camphor resistance protein CrcB [Gemmobacter caeni]|uniref:Fluoride-specific ion channel FluC n=1 Tax=Gemmobacter caeni TaxID=589035 RepID=A0A2T6A2U1_9RHOB|nr:fluoride efflux transporter CrcB [Gemmobacter caeni]PTX38130.1 camphor resistance protein CrcB [Gemmobacter caeni]TWI89764.1 camphor resistance protein CrcB [Gemmobacter caeni]